MSQFGDNLFAALDSDEEDTAPPLPKPQSQKKNVAVKNNKKKEPTRKSVRNGERRSNKAPRGDDRASSSWGGPSFDARSDRSDRRRNRGRRGGREFDKKKTRNPKNGYGKAKAGPKKGGAGAHNWGTAMANADDTAENVVNGEKDPSTEDKAGDVVKTEPDAVDDAEEKQEEPEVETLGLEEFKAMSLEKRKNKAAFSTRATRKIEVDDGSDVYVKKAENNANIVHHKKHGRAGHNKNNKKLGDVANFFRSAPRPRNDDFGGRGRGRGRGRGGGRSRGARGRGGRGYSNSRSNGTRRGAPRTIHLGNESEFPSL